MSMLQCLPGPRKNGQRIILVAPRATQQVDLLGQALGEGGAQLGQQQGIFPRGSGQGGIECSGYFGHGGAVVDDALRRGLSCPALW